MANHHITRIREQYETDVAAAEHARALGLAQISAAGTPQKQIIEGTGYSRETVRKLIAQGRAIIAAQPATCGDPNPVRPDMLCTDVPHHYGVHDHLRYWWPNESYPAAAGPCITEDCTLYNGHPGDHHIVERLPVEDVDVPF